MERRARVVVGGGMLALFVFALGVFLLPFAFPTPAPIVTRFQATRLFSPNDDGRRDTARVSVRMREPGSVTLDVVDPDGNVVQALFDDTVPRGWVRAAWGGRDPSGATVPDGAYAIRLRARAGRKQFNTSRRIVVDTQGPGLAVADASSAGLGEVDPPAQCLVTAVPDGDGVIGFTALSPRDGHPVRTFGPRPGRDGRPTRWAWDGLDASGGALPPGLVTVEVRATDAARNTIVARRTCWIGNAVGRALPASPRPGASVRVRLRTPRGRALPGGTPVTLRLYRRSGSPGRAGGVLGGRVARAVRATAATARIRLPATVAPAGLWLTVRTPDGLALVDLGDAR